MSCQPQHLTPHQGSCKCREHAAVLFHTSLLFTSAAAQPDLPSARGCAHTDIWALGCVLHLLLSAANTSWSNSFGPSADDEAAIQKEPLEQWDALLTACITRHQDAWVRHA